jgi:hypothetical protein
MTLQYREEYMLLTLDIKGLYFNEPINEVTHITHSFFPYNNTDEILQQILHILHTILHQNYF